MDGEKQGACACIIDNIYLGMIPRHAATQGRPKRSTPKKQGIFASEDQVIDRSPNPSQVGHVRQPNRERSIK